MTILAVSNGDASSIRDLQIERTGERHDAKGNHRQRASRPVRTRLTFAHFLLSTYIDLID